MIYLSAGHHKKDPGAIGYNGVREADLTIELRNLIVKHLRAADASFILDSDYETLAQYKGRIKPGSGSVLCEPHFNSSESVESKGTECIVKDGPNAFEKAMAAEICAAVSSASNIYNRGVKTESQSHRGRLAILHTKAGISALPEICFINNKDDLKLYQDSKEEIAKRIAVILVKYDSLAA